MPKLEPVELSFFETAPAIIHRAAHVAAPRGVVFAALANDPASWGDWFPGFSHDGRWESASPQGVGSVRTVRSFGVRFTETVLAWDDDERWAFRVDESSAPMAKAFAEDYRLTDAGTGTLLSWTIALNPVLGLRLAAPLLGFGFGLVLRRAAAQLPRVA